MNEMNTLLFRTTNIFIRKQSKEIERLNNDIKELLKENENKEKVIKAQDNIIKEVREYINKIPTQPVIRVFKKELLEILDKVDSLNKENLYRVKDRLCEELLLYEKYLNKESKQ